ncbi:MAG: 30S ribosome-binding factor RbfA [Bacteroidota bacterium]
MESKRQRQVASVIQRHISDVLLKEGRYFYEDALVTVTNVRVSPDIGIARIYLSVYNTPNKEAVIDVLNFNIQRLKNNLAARIRKHVRRIPNLELYLDDTLDEMYRLNEIFDKLEEERNNDPSTEPES